MRKNKCKPIASSYAASYRKVRPTGRVARTQTSHSQGGPFAKIVIPSDDPMILVSAGPGKIALQNLKNALLSVFYI